MRASSEQKRNMKYVPHSLLLSCYVLSDSLWPPWTAARQASLSFTISWTLLKLMSIESVMPSNRFILCHPLLLLPSIFPSIRVFSSESALHIRWPKYWSFSFSISPFSEYSGLISRHKRQHNVWLHFCEMFKVGIPIETQSRLAVSRGWGKGVMRNDCYCGWNFLRGWGNVLEFDSSHGCTTLWIY